MPGTAGKMRGASLPGQGRRRYADHLRQIPPERMENLTGPWPAHRVRRLQTRVTYANRYS